MIYSHKYHYTLLKINEKSISTIPVHYSLEKITIILMFYFKQFSYWFKQKTLFEETTRCFRVLKYLEELVFGRLYLNQ